MRRGSEYRAVQPTALTRCGKSRRRRSAGLRCGDERASSRHLQATGPSASRARPKGQRELDEHLTSPTASPLARRTQQRFGFDNGDSRNLVATARKKNPVGVMPPLQIDPARHTSELILLTSCNDSVRLVQFQFQHAAEIDRRHAEERAVSKLGERTIRRLLILGANAVIRQACLRGAPARSWLAQMLTRRPKMLVTVALANKMARVV